MTPPLLLANAVATFNVMSATDRKTGFKALAGELTIPGGGGVGFNTPTVVCCACEVEMKATVAITHKPIFSVCFVFMIFYCLRR